MLCSLPCTRVHQRFIAGLAARRQPRFFVCGRRMAQGRHFSELRVRQPAPWRERTDLRESPRRSRPVARWTAARRRRPPAWRRIGPTGPRDIPPADPEHTTPGAGAWLPAPVSPTATDRRSPEPPGGPPETPRPTRPLGSVSYTHLT